MPWLRNEDAALKFKLQGLLVNDANAPAGGRQVKVRYRLPETELANLDYPIIILEHAGLFPAPEREHRGYIQYPYAPEGYAPWWRPGIDLTYDPALSPYRQYFPVPYNFDYQVTVYGRSMVEHIQPLVTQLATYNYLPYHFGFLNVPQDHTVRTLQLMGGPEFAYTKDNDGKRRYEVRYRVRVFSEVVPPIPTPVPVTDIHVDLSVYEDVENLRIEDLTQSFDIKAAGLGIGWNTESNN